jgi:ribosomal protein L37E
MAMSKCKECGKAVSTLAKTCPNCGVPKPAKKIKKFSTTSKTKKKIKIYCPNVPCSA